MDLINPPSKCTPIPYGLHLLPSTRDSSASTFITAIDRCIGSYSNITYTIWHPSSSPSRVEVPCSSLEVVPCPHYCPSSLEVVVVDDLRRLEKINREVPCQVELCQVELFPEEPCPVEPCLEEPYLADLYLEAWIALRMGRTAASVAQ
ncbi:hypothetical protein BABINDRAFT_146992 [Babjeviella inositovora NRRL Y-12698]|uniref:Uncharacterized protein n=1 Tax=Babjeviella inositovora NRRL Y-12698 TaxID=984486 RepID=A0A1E3QMV4_9ASCO|nr:uncharacterized protein BABINDRAFT_146992 [Babjeviella inositovora NRRL Y-12698]ODQ79015.1 hypothetical protein BABINDRAFT_146992 [Babjeviella inositovora NRRL Y-12698]